MTPKARHAQQTRILKNWGDAPIGSPVTVEKDDGSRVETITTAGTPVGPTAVEALRKARATAGHGRASLAIVPDCYGCEIGEDGSVWDLSVNGHEPMGTWHDWHDRCASAALDGFAVAEVTRAERELER